MRIIKVSFYLIFSFSLLSNCVNLIAKEVEGKKDKLLKTNGSPSMTKFNINNISTFFGNDGMSDLSNTGDSGFKYPNGSGKTLFYESGFLYGGYVNNEWRVSGSTYNRGQIPGRILPGTVREDPNLPTVRIYRVRRNYNDTQADYSKEITDEGKTQAEIKVQYATDWNEWPAQYGAPFEDKNGNSIYEPATDIPGVPGADQTIWFVCNDLDPTQAQKLYGSVGLGLEMQATIWGYNQQSALGDALFRKYTLINKGGNKVDSMYVCMWSDPDLGGDAVDDFAGCDTTLSLGFIYNGDDFDPSYGEFIPAAGFDFLQGPITKGSTSDNAFFKNKIRTGYKNIPMTAFFIFTQGVANWGDPTLGNYSIGALQVRNLFQGKIGRLGTPFTDPLTGKTTKFAVPGDPVTGKGWIDGILFPKQDRRLGLVSGPFTLAAGDTQEVVVGQLAAGGGTGVNRLSAVSLLKSAHLEIKQVFLNNIPKQSPFLLTINSNPINGGTANGAGTYNSGSLISVIASPNPGYRFVSWTENGTIVSTNAQYTFKIDSNRNLTANFTAITQFTVTINSNPTVGGSNLGNGTYNSGTSVTVIATANIGYAFSNWTEGGIVVSNSVNYTFTISYNRNLVANFQESIGGFTRFTVTANAGGVLTTPVMGTLAFNANGFPTLDGQPANGINDRPQLGQMKNSTALWGIATGSNNANDPSYSYFISRVTQVGARWPQIIPYDFEIRFTAAGSKGVIAFTTGAVVQLPFELWNTGIGTPNNKADDFKLVAYVNDVDGNGLFGLDKIDHPVSGGDDDSETDWIYFYDVTDKTPGTKGYDAAVASNFTSGIGSEIMRRVVLVSWNGGSVSDVNWPANQKALLPETGTIFRIETTKINLNQYNVTLNSTVGGTVSGGGQYYDGQLLIVTATPNSGYKFDSWMENGVIISYEENYTFNITSNRVLLANFTSINADVYEPNETRATATQVTFTNNSWQSISGTEIYPTNDQDWYKLNLNAGNRITATCHVTSQLDARIVLYSLSGKLLEVDYGGNGTDEILDYSVSSTGTYYIGVGYFGTLFKVSGTKSFPSIGSYQLSITNSILQTPVATTASNVSQVSFSANWGSVSGATGYYLDVATNNTFTSFVTGFNNKDVSNVTSYSVTGLTPGTSYYYRVRSYNIGGTSGYSNTVILTTTFLQYTVSISSNPTAGGSTTQSGSGTYNTGSSVTLTANAGSGYQFINWTENGTLVATSSIYTFTITGDRNLIANFMVSQINISQSYSFTNSTSQTSYKLIGLPGENNFPLSDIITGTVDNDWVAYRDNGQTSNYYEKYNGSSNFYIKPGIGFWVLSKNTINVNRTVQSVTVNSNGQYGIPLQSGWNIISNPFSIAVNWSNVASKNSVGSDVPWDYTGSFVLSQTLEPYKGYYFKNTNNLGVLNIPYPTLGKISGETELQTQNELTISLNGENKNISEVKIGFNKESKVDYDKYDIYKPVSDFEAERIVIYNPELSSADKYLYRDMRSGEFDKERYHLKLKVIPNKLYTISLTNTSKNNFVYLLDNKLNVVYNLREENKVSFSSNTSEKNYELIISKNKIDGNNFANVLPTTNKLYQNYPNPFNPTTTIRYSLENRSYVSIKIYNVIGAEVKELLNGYVDKGYYEMMFDGKELPSGIYFCRLITEQKTEIIKLLLVK